MQPFVRLSLLIGLFSILSATKVCGQGEAADSLLASGDYARAAQRYAEAGDRQSLLRAGMAYIDIDSTQAALRYLEMATRDDKGEPVIDSLSGLAWHKMGVAAYNAYEDSLAMVYYRRALAVAYFLTSLARKDGAFGHIRASVPIGLNIGAEQATLTRPCILQNGKRGFGYAV